MPDRPCGMGRGREREIAREGQAGPFRMSTVYDLVSKGGTSGLEFMLLVFLLLLHMIGLVEYQKVLVCALPVCVYACLLPTHKHIR